MAVSGPLLEGIVWGTILGLGTVLSRFIRSVSLRPFAFGTVCFAVEHGLDRLGLPHVPLSSCAVSEFQAQAVAVLGVPFLDSVAITLGAALATRQWRVIAAGSAAFILTCVIGRATATSEGSTTVHLVQPNIASEDFHAAGWSLATRSAIQLQFQRLTRQAARRSPGVIIWPEGGSSVPDLQSVRRRRAIDAALGRSPSAVIVSTTLLTPTLRYNGAGLLVGGAVTAFTTKQNLVPLAESDVARGPLRVLESDFGRLGVLVCFDGVFGSSARALRSLGAEALVLVTDDASFGSTVATRIHLATTRLAARSIGLPLVVASNSGPSLVIDTAGKTLARMAYGRSGVLTSRLPLRHQRGPSPGPIVPDVMAACIALWWTLLLRRQGRDGRRWQSARSWRRVLHGSALLALLPALAMLSGVAWECVRLYAEHALTPADVVNGLRLRSGAVGVTDGLGPAFLQLKPESCGLAALAFALTELGEDATEPELERDCRLAPRALSLQELGDCSRVRGVPATGVRADWEWLAARGQRPTILHMGDHFVTAVLASSEEAIIFDPAKGAVLAMPRSQVMVHWSGNALALDLASPIGAIGVAKDE